jgi:hypothetical protein
MGWLDELGPESRREREGLRELVERNECGGQVWEWQDKPNYQLPNGLKIRETGLKHPAWYWLWQGAAKCT